MNTCTIDDCLKPVVGGGLCRMHYMRRWRYGDANATKYLVGADAATKLAKRGRWDGECFVWTGSTRGHMGYGQGQFDGRLQAVHRVQWEWAHGPVPEGMMVLHTCDNPPCYRLEHLFLGSNQANMDDMKAKGRYPQLTRDNMPHAKLSVEQAREVIRRYRRGGISQQTLANEYGCHQSTISDITLRAHLYN